MTVGVLLSANDTAVMIGTSARMKMGRGRLAVWDSGRVGQVEIGHFRTAVEVLMYIGVL